jgi:hypothetical protein
MIVKDFIKINSNADEYSQKDAEVIDLLEELNSRSSKPMRVIDIGGAARIRIPSHTTHCLDFQPEKLKDPYVHCFVGDMEIQETWEPIFEEVKSLGKFDFVVCSHTLEDLNAPHQVIKNMEAIAHAGMVAVPTKHIETKKWEGGGDMRYMGYHHHRWIYTIKNGTLMAYPKMGLMEYTNFRFKSSDVYHQKFGDKQTEMTFAWSNKIPVEFIPPYQYLDNFTHPTKKSKLEDLVEYDDIDDILLNGY